MKLLIKKEVNMDFKNSLIVNNKAYFYENDATSENCNFHDYFIENHSPHFVIENGWDDKFSDLIFGREVKAVTISGCNDISFISKYFRGIKQLIIDCESIASFNIISCLEDLQDLSFVCSKNFSAELNLPSNLKSLTIDWKSKFKFTGKSPSSLEFISIFDGNNIDWSFFLDCKNLKKIDLNNCSIDDSDFIFTFQKLQCLTIYNCKNIKFSNEIERNVSVKYIYFTKVLVGNIEWVSKLENLDIIILESCGDIKDIFPLKYLIPTIRGVSFSGNTNIINGDLEILKQLKNLHNCFLAPKKHYSLKSKLPWSWNNFGIDKKELFI